MKSPFSGFCAHAISITAAALVAAVSAHARAGETQKETVKTPAEATPKLPKLPDEAYTKTGVHCQKFPEEDAKRPGGELMGDVWWAPGVRDGAEEPLVLGLRVASDAKWKIGGQARVQLVVRAAGGSDVRFPQTPRSDNGLSVVAIDKDGKEHMAEIAQFRGFLTFNYLLLPRSHVVMVKAFTLRFDSDKRLLDGTVLANPGVAAFHLPPGDYKLRCKWNDARPDVAHEGEWTGELVSVEHKFKLAAAAAPNSETRKSGAQLKPASPAAEKPKRANVKIATAEGDYDLGGGARLGVERPVGPDGKPVSTMMALLSFESAALPGSTIETDFTPHFISIGGGPFRFVWERGAGVLWLVKQGIITKFDFMNRAQVKEETIAPERTSGLPEAVKEALFFPGGEVQKPAQTEGSDGSLPKGAQAKITPEALLGFWKGTMNEEDIMLSFHRSPVDPKIQTDLYVGEATIGALMSFRIAPDGSSVTLHGPVGDVEFGRLTPGDGGTLQIEVTDKRTTPGKVTLTRNADEPADEPRQKEPRALFAIWKKAALPDGKIPGALIGKLAEQVKSYVKANPNLDSGMKLPKLVPRFDAARDWPPTDVVSLLNDVAYYSTEPIEALMPKTATVKLPR